MAWLERTGLFEDRTIDYLCHDLRRLKAADPNHVLFSDGITYEKLWSNHPEVFGEVPLLMAGFNVLGMPANAERMHTIIKQAKEKSYDVEGSLAACACCGIVDSANVNDKYGKFTELEVHFAPDSMLSTVL